MFPLRRFLAAAAVTSCTLFTLNAHASCGPVLDALDKVWEQSRFAQYDLERATHPLTGRPSLIRIGTSIWVNGGEGTPWESANDPGHNPMAWALRREIAKGTATCEDAGRGTYRGVDALRYKVNGALSSPATGRLVLWIGRSNGLPLFHEFEKRGPGGHVWVYGDAVNEPTDVRKKRK